MPGRPCKVEKPLADCRSGPKTALARRRLLARLPEKGVRTSYTYATAIIERYRQDAALTSELRFWLASLGTIKLVLGQIQTNAETLDRDIRVVLHEPAAASAKP